MVNTIVGIDLAATLQGDHVGIAILQNDRGAFVLTGHHCVRYTNDIFSIINNEILTPPVLLSIDAPLKLPLYCNDEAPNIHAAEQQWPMIYTYRPWEYLIFHGIGNEYKISGRSFSQIAITYRGQILKSLIERNEWQLISSPNQLSSHSFIEVFPNLTVGILERSAIGANATERQKLRRKFVDALFAVSYLGVTLRASEPYLIPTNPDVLDSIICAWTGALFSKSLAVCLGDDGFGFVICPYEKRFVNLLETKRQRDPLNPIYRYSTFQNC